MKRLLPIILAFAFGSCRNAETPALQRQILGDLSASVRASARTADKSAKWIDFEFYRDSRIFLPVTVNGYETIGVLDSGAASTTIDAAVARAAGIRGTQQVTASGTGGSVQVQLAHGVSVNVGGLVLGDLTVAILDLSDVADRLLGRALPVILGAEVFNEVVVDIDYPQRRIAFRDPVKWEYDGDGEIVPLTSLGTSRSVEIRLEDGEPIMAGFDIGQGAPVTILKPHADETKLLDGRLSGTIRAGGVGGATIDRLITVESIEFGGVRFENVPVIVPTQAVGAFNTRRIDGNLGTGIYRRFRMIVDYPRSRLILEPDAQAQSLPFWRNRAGLFFERTARGLEVVHVSQGSPAAGVGMQIGDVVTEINGQPVGDDYWLSDQWRWSALPAGTVVVVSVASSRSFTITLEDFY